VWIPSGDRQMADGRRAIRSVEPAEATPEDTVAEEDGVDTATLPLHYAEARSAMRLTSAASSKTLGNLLQADARGKITTSCQNGITTVFPTARGMYSLGVVWLRFVRVLNCQMYASLGVEYAAESASAAKQLLEEVTNERSELRLNSGRSSKVLENLIFSRNSEFLANAPVATEHVNVAAVFSRDVFSTNRMAEE
jgi:hypothetical protein